MVRTEGQIPKIIHYCWFGRNPEPELMKRCKQSWRQHLPDYEFMLWNEENFDLSSNRFAQEAYTAKKWAFVSDYVRFYALKHFGGIYMDTDVEVLRNLDCFLEHAAFTGYENELFIPTGIIGATKGHPWVEQILSYYQERPFVREDGSLDMVPNTAIITQISEQHFNFDSSKGMQTLKDGVVIYPQEYFCPKSYYDNSIEVTENTYTIHHFSGSWHSGFDRAKLTLHQWFIRIFGKKLHNKLLKMRHGN